MSVGLGQEGVARERKVPQPWEVHSVIPLGALGTPCLLLVPSRCLPDGAQSLSA